MTQMINNKNYELLLGNCVDLIKNISDTSIDCIVTDPPYKMTSRGNTGSTGGMLKKRIVSSGQVFQYNNIDCVAYAPEFYRVLKDGTHCYVMTNHINLQHILNTFTESGFKFIKSLIWNKGNKIMGHYYMSCYEYILMFRKGKGRKINYCGTPDILQIKNQKTKGSDGKNLHDTEKPVELMQTLVQNSTNENEIVLDPFMGIGSTGIATKYLNRKFIGMEIDKTYFEIAKERIESIG